MTGKFITFEGGEGSGKSTQLKLLTEAFHTARLPCIATREPGGSPGGERIRAMLVEGKADAWDVQTETLLFYAARLDHVNTLIKPALAQDKTVLCDRFSDSTLVYQGVGKGLPADYIHMLHRLCLGDFMPDLTVILDIDPAEGLKRAGRRQGCETRFEGLGVEFHQRIRAGFLSLAREAPERCVVVDASGDPQTVQGYITGIMRQKLNLKL